MSTFSMKTLAIATVIGGMVAGAISASAALNLPKQNENFTFNTNMRIGSTGTDVMNLQKVLNGWPQTRVSVSGAGSLGLETSYFGPATRAAVNKFQALHLVELGITAPTGNVFAGTRGLLNMAGNGSTPTTGGTLPTGCTTTSGFSPVTGASCSTGTTPSPVSTGPVSVMLSASQPTGTIVAGQAGAVLANLSFTGNGTVTQIELQRIGVSSDQTVPNVYLYDGATRLTDSASVITGGYIRFNGPNGIFTVNGSRTITVRADILAGTNGQSAGVKLNSITTLGGSPTTFTNVMGNTLFIGSVSNGTTVDFTSLDTTVRTVDAGTPNYNVWRATVNIGQHDGILRSATFKFVGSAPVDSLSNIGLYVDGAKVATSAGVSTASGNQRLVFDLGTNPYVLRTGSHQIDVRGDVIKGSNRTMTFSIENRVDLMIEDSQLTGVNVTPTVIGATLTNGSSAYGLITVNKGSITVNVDPTFNANKVTGGGTNVVIAQYTLKAYGEDVKVNNLRVIPTLTGTTPAVAGLTNVALYVNGGQIGTSQNFTGSSTGNLDYTLGSQLIVPAGQTVTLAIKADIRTAAGANYTAGVIVAALSNGGAGNNAQGQSSYELTTVSTNGGITGNTLTVSSGAAAFAKTSGFTVSNVAPNTANFKIGSFTLQAGSAEDTVVNSATVNLTAIGSSTSPLTNYSNIVIKDGSTVLGTPVGNAQGVNTFSFSDITVTKNTTKTFDVYADIGSQATSTIQADMGITYRGNVSNVSTTITPVTGVVITSLQATLAASALVSTSPVSQYVVGGTTMNIASFKLKTANDTAATVRELRFTITGTDAISTITVNGQSASVVSGTAIVSGLNIPISQTGTDVPVTVVYSGFKNTTIGGSLTAGIATTTLSLNYVEAVSGAGTTIVDNVTVVSSRVMKLFATKPTVTGMNGSAFLTASTMKIGEFTIAADANGRVAANTVGLVTSISTTGTTSVSNVHLRENGNTTPITNTVSSITSSTPYALTLSPTYDIPAGTSKTFEVWGTIANTGGFGQNAQVATQLDPNQSTFLWNDTVVTNGTGLTGVGILNFPSSSYLVKNN